MTSLRLQVLVLMLVAALPSVGLVLLGQREEERLATASVEDRAERLAALATSAVGGMVKGAAQVLTTLTAQRSLAGAEPDRCSDELDRVRVHLGGRAGPTSPTPVSGQSTEPPALLSTIARANAAGEVDCGSPAVTVGTSVRERPWHAAVLAKRALVVSDVHVDLAGGPGVVVAQPILEDDGAPRGTLFGTVGARAFQRLVESDAPPSNGALVVYDGQGVLLARNPPFPDLVGQKVADPKILERMRTTPRFTTRSMGLDGVERIYAIQRVALPEATDLFVAVGIAQEDALTEVRGPASASVALLAGAMLFLAAALVAVDQRVVRRIARIGDTVRRISAGDLGARVDAAWAADEIGVLALQTDEMAAKLEQRTAEAEARANALRAARDQLQHLAARLDAGHEAERTRLAREVHDVLGQELTGLKLDVASLQRRAAKSPAEAVKELVATRSAAMLAQIDGVIETVRRLARDLRPSALDDLGLAAALEAAAHELAARSELTATLDLTEEPLPLHRAATTALFRIAQEALTNVARHASAKTVHLTLALEDDAVLLEVADDGRGITDAERTGTRSLGLVGMRERAEIHGGTVAIAPARGGGTAVTVRFPRSLPSAEVGGATQGTR